ncbi:MAG: YhcH/YjgK/YiaL family protein [Clostridiaceae bacterium]|nr:YhcH/YjgK/YiaL family protein [Clostridiaceae bacterium]
MILTDLAHMSHYAALSESISLGLRFLADASPDTLTPGRYTLDGSRVYVNVMTYDTEPKALVFEAHRRYIDIQCILRGKERMEAALLDSLAETQSYDETGDYALYEGCGVSFDAPAGTVVFFYPEDAHAPGLLSGEPSHILKAVVKVEIDA